jgi:arsenate reductase
MSLILYGLKSCDTCKKALKALDLAGIDARFVDIRADADLSGRVPVWLEAAGAKALLNRASTTWRGLGPDDQARADTEAGTVGLLVANPTLIKRPVIEAGGQVHVGWSPAVQSALGL